ncbi:hypothetical protein F8388_017409 [Cannabis sativa]|uniref:Reverse transcriptase zinc-binding domain-containing protein n=1 Tax=Cannabis sativa TaxID=3483 RepID=A0A7J6I3M2_CANSA|nr:hypothetical protein F8388_017409 [Cannabis sativa]KAF4401805.1 hypothetical protein G4B88_013092 [Cannabis sativa]
MLPQSCRHSLQVFEKGSYLCLGEPGKSPIALIPFVGPSDRVGQVSVVKIRSATNSSMLNQAAKGSKFKVNKFYNELIGAAKTPYAATVWHKLIVPEHRFIFRQIFNEQLLTRDLLSRFLPLPSGLCMVCEDAPETHSHLFMECIFTKKLIDLVESWSGNLNWPDNLSELHQRTLPAKADLASMIMNAVTSASLYLMWKNRNDRLSNVVCNLASSFSKEIKCIVKARVFGFHCTSQKKKDRYDLSKRIVNAVLAAVLYSLWKNRNKCIFDLCCVAPSCLSLEIRKVVQMRIVSKGPFEDSAAAGFLFPERGSRQMEGTAYVKRSGEVVDIQASTAEERREIGSYVAADNHLRSGCLIC